MNQNEHPWYDERNTSSVAIPPPEPYTSIPPYAAPKEIFNYLDKHIQGQTDAKKAASLLVYKAFNNIKQNIFFCGPSGCGKTEIWRQLQQLFPDRIVIADSSSITVDGWSGSTKWKTILEAPIFRQPFHTICVMDEADKMISPKINGNRENVAHTVMSEGLKIIKGTIVNIKVNNIPYQIDTHKISFVFLGAFSNKASEIAEKTKGPSIGFGISSSASSAYDKPLTVQDIIDFGAMPEFMGRIQRIVNLDPVTEADYIRILTESDYGPIQRIEQQYKLKLHLSHERCLELANSAFRSGLGIRAVESALSCLVDDALFENCRQNQLSL